MAYLTIDKAMCMGDYTSPFRRDKVCILEFERGVIFQCSVFNDIKKFHVLLCGENKPAFGGTDTATT